MLSKLIKLSICQIKKHVITKSYTVSLANYNCCLFMSHHILLLTWQLHDLYYSYMISMIKKWNCPVKYRSNNYCLLDTLSDKVCPCY